MGGSQVAKIPRDVLEHLPGLYRRAAERMIECGDLKIIDEDGRPLDRDVPVSDG